MENVNATTATANTTNQKHSQQHQQLLQHHQEQEQQHEHQQQFCLRWHNHQTSLLSTLPVLLDQSHLTDVTISAEGRTLRAHRVVLSACSTFFLELFHTLDTTNHPIVIIPGASFAAIVALLTFMYSGEVNVYEEQIPMLLNLAETLGIKGLADVQHNKTNRRAATAPPAPPPETEHFLNALHKEDSDISPTPATPPPPTSTSMAPPTLPPSPLTYAVPAASAQLPLISATTVPSAFNTPLLGGSKLPTPLESFFIKSLQFYPNFLPQPLNFSQTALNKTSELLAKYQQQFNSLYQDALGMASKNAMPTPFGAEDYASTTQACAGTLVDDSSAGNYENAKRFCSADKQRQLIQQPAQSHHHHYPHQPPTSLQAPLQNTLATQAQTLSQQQKDMKRIDKIVENLRKTPVSGENSSTSLGTQQATTQLQQKQQQSPQQHLQNHLQTPSLSVKASSSGSFTPTLQSPHLSGSKSPWSVVSAGISTTQSQLQQHPHSHALPYLSAEDQVAKLQQQIDQFASCSRNLASTTASSSSGAIGADMKLHTQTDLSLLSTLHEKPPSGAMNSTSASSQPKPPSNSKLYATCFICHKQLSNQYNLRVHLETHQNVRYACNVCSHVSRSKDALRKHVSYRHPGAPSPCETEARRKRAAKAANASPPVATATTPTSSCASDSGSITPTSPAAGVSAPFQLNPLDTIVPSASATAVGHTSGASSNTPSLGAEAQMAAAAQLSSAYMFLPNQFHLAAAAAAAAQQEQQRQQQQQHQQQQQQQQRQQQQQQHQQHLQNALDASNTAAAVAALSYATTSLASVSTTTTAVTTSTNGEDSTITGGSANNVLIKREPSPVIGSPGTAGSAIQSAGVSLSPTRLP
ncbi:protein tramtrack, beta isoform isoform X2 [Eurosta solidaginis]|uniref:protein tramtrack, beta isoform isoform X2 n=1 Tax=Eurosta solidaginis TaxID=178769 RepID=UPI00353082D5